MRCALWIAALAACGTSGPDVRLTTKFDVTVMTGLGPSTLDALYGQTIDLEITLDDVKHLADDPEPGCKQTTIAPYPAPAGRLARGATAATVKSEILDLLPDWDLRFEVCTGGASSIVADAAINELNLGLGCAGVPEGALLVGASGYPELTSFTATRCNAVILDVVTNRQIGNPDFEMTFEVGPDHVP